MKNDTPGLRGLAEEIRAMSPARRLRFAADLLDAAAASGHDLERAQGFSRMAETVLRSVQGAIAAPRLRGADAPGCDGEAMLEREAEA